MLREVAFTFTDGFVNPTFRLTTIQPLFDGNGAFLQWGEPHTVSPNTGAPTYDDPRTVLSAEERDVVGALVQAAIDASSGVLA